VGGERVPVNKRILFAVTSEDEIEPPFEIDVTNEWDFFDEDVSDSELNSIVIKWLNDNQYDAIYIPLYFGNVYSDYMGLRLAMHIRLTDTSNRYTPIFIYGVSTYEEVRKNECFEVFKFQSVYLIGADNRSLVDSLAMKSLISENGKDIDRILLNVPSNIGDDHSVANRWAMYRWCDMLKWPGDTPAISSSGFEDSLYFKYLVAKFGGHDKFSKKHKYDIRIDGIEGKTILYVDDEYDKGWETLLRIIFESNNANFLCFKGFDKKCSRAELIDRVKDYLDGNDADCYLIDLRLHDDDFEKSQSKNLTGHEIAKYIKKKNAGNQIVVFTASNKIWNLKEEIFKIGASGYAMKESPDLNLKRQESLNLYQEFASAIKQACKMSYLKDLVDKQNSLKGLLPSITQLDSIVNLLSRDQGKNDQDLLGAALLAEMVFIEDFIKNQLGYELLSIGEGATLKVSLCSKKQKGQYQQLVTGHIFFKRIQNGSHSSVVDVSEYSASTVDAPSGMCDVTGSDISLVTAVLMMIFNLPRTLVKKYVDLKFIRNTQIAHPTNPCVNEKKLSSDLIVDFYLTVICPIVVISKGTI
jgi:DNA-binding NarL/FixJ family response regulator